MGTPGTRIAKAIKKMEFEKHPLGSKLDPKLQKNVPKLYKSFPKTASEQGLQRNLQVAVRTVMPVTGPLGMSLGETTRSYN